MVILIHQYSNHKGSLEPTFNNYNYYNPLKTRNKKQEKQTKTPNKLLIYSIIKFKIEIGIYI